MKGKWKKAPLETLCEFYSGSGFPERFQGNKSGDYPYIKVSDMSLAGNSIFLAGANNWVSKNTAVILSAKVIPAGATAFAKIGAAMFLNRRRMTIQDTCFDNNMMAAVPKDIISDKFLYYIFTTLDFSDFSQTTALPSLSLSALKSFCVYLPDAKETQQHIADILTSCDEVIEQTEKAIAKYRNIKAGMLQDLFTRGLDANGKLRPKPEDAPGLYKDSSLGKIPKEWEVFSFSQCFELHRNNTFSRDYLDNQPGSIYNIHYGDILVKYQTCVNPKNDGVPCLLINKVSSLCEDFVQNGDVVFADTAEDDTVGKAVEVINENGLKIVAGLHTIFCHPVKKVFASRWLGYFVNSDVFHSQLLPYVVGSKVSSISRENIKKTLVLCPEIKEQENMTKKMYAIDAQIEDEEQTLGKYRSIKLGLMKKLLTPPEGALET